MDDEERKRIDEAALRLLGYRQCESLPSLWFGPYDSVSVGKDGPSQDARHVVPLAEALRKAGWVVQFGAEADGDWSVSLWKPEVDYVDAYAGTLQEALALAAAWAVGEEP